jgi:hypothetical protein
MYVLGALLLPIMAVGGIALIVGGLIADRDELAIAGAIMLGGRGNRRIARPYRWMRPAGSVVGTIPRTSLSRSNRLFN